MSLIVAAVPACGAAAAQDFRSGLSAYNSGDYARAFHDWLGLAEQGDPAAEAGIGFLFHKGLGVTQDDAEAATWFVKAAEQGQAEAQLLLGTLFFFGTGRAAKLRLRFRLVRHRRDERPVGCVGMPRCIAGAHDAGRDGAILQDRQRVAGQASTTRALTVRLCRHRFAVFSC